MTEVFNDADKYWCIMIVLDMNRAEVSKLNVGTTLQLTSIVLRYPCLCSEPTKELEFKTQDGNRLVIIRNPIVYLRAWKVFMLCLWKAERYISYGNGIVLVIVPKSKLKPLLREEELTAKGLWNILAPLSDVSYMVIEKKQVGNKIEYDSFSFRLLYKISRHKGEENNYEVGIIELLIDEVFYKLCFESKVFFYVPFLTQLRSPFAINLFMYLTANWDAQKFSEHLLFERMGYVNQAKKKEKEKRRILKKALTDLQEIGYIKNFTYNAKNKQWIIERYDSTTLRARAMELLRQIENRAQAIKKRETEKKRQWRERKKKQ